MYPQPLEFGGRHEDSRGEAEGGGGGVAAHRWLMIGRRFCLDI